MDYRKEVLPNGVRLLTIPMPQVGSVTAMIGVGAGGRYEEKRIQGLAHFTEHMAFKGTERRPTALSIATGFEALGAKHNAMTGKERTAFFAKATAKHLPRILDLLTDIVFHSTFSAKEIETEKGVILEELRMYRDVPQDWVDHLWEEVLFGDHPLGWELAGTEESIPRIKREDFLAFQDRWYRSRNLVVAVAGNLSALNEGDLTRFFADLPQEEAEKPSAFEAKQIEPAILLEERPTDQTHLALGVRAYPRTHPNREKLLVLTTILGVGMSSRLFQEVREKRGLAYYIGAGWDQLADAGALTVSAGVNNARLEEALKVTLGEMVRLTDELVPEEELQKAKEIIRGRLLLGLESTNEVALYFLSQELFEGKIETPEEKLAKIDAVTAGQVREVAEELFINTGLNLALIGPFSDPEKFRPLLTLKP